MKNEEVSFIKNHIKPLKILL